MPDVPSDADLIAGCLSRDEGAWRKLIVRYRRLIYSIPVTYRVADPDEIFQTVSVRLFENLSKLKNRESLAAWISTTTRRECIAARKKQDRSVSMEDKPVEDSFEDPPDVVEALFNLECEHVLHLALERLDTLCKALLQAFYIEDPTPSYKEMAERTGRPIGSLGPTRGRCLGKLREHYLDLDGEIPPDVST